MVLKREEKKAPRRQRGWGGVVGGAWFKLCRGADDGLRECSVGGGSRSLIAPRRDVARHSACGRLEQNIRSPTTGTLLQPGGAGAADDAESDGHATFGGR